LLSNRPFIGKEFENLVAKRFDGTMEKSEKGPKEKHKRHGFSAA
jgi:hypothetical protein